MKACAFSKYSINIDAITMSIRRRECICSKILEILKKERKIIKESFLAKIGLVKLLKKKKII